MKPTDGERKNEALDRAIEEKIAQMERGGAFPPRFGHGDYIAVAAVALACLALVIAGAWL